MPERDRHVSHSDARPARVGWTTFLGGLALGVGVALLLVACIGGPDCGRTDEITSYPDANTPPVTLDASSPAVEQRITVHISAAALPANHVTEMTLLVLATAQAPGPTSSASPGPSSGAPALTPEFTIIRDDTGEVVPTTIPRTRSFSPTYAKPLAWLPLDCAMDADCDRVYRIRVAIPGLRDDQRLAVAWSVLVDLTYSGVDTYCGMPDDGSATIEKSDPVSLPATRVAFAAPVAGEEASGAIVARHVTVASTGSAPSAASLRLSILQAVPEAQDEVPWHPWVRVLADDSPTPLASAIVGYPVDGVDATLDAPVLGDCAGSGDCQRGYWVLFQNHADAPRWPVNGPDVPPASLGKMSWIAAATAAYGTADATAPTLRLTLEDLPGGPLPESTIDAAADLVTLDSLRAPIAIDAVFTMPDRPRPIDGLDPLAASMVIVHLHGHGDETETHLEGDGAEPMTDYFNGDGTANLIAHPFDRCPPAGPCTVTLRLVGSAYRAEPRPKSYHATLEWSLSVLGAPSGTTIKFGTPYELPTP